MSRDKRIELIKQIQEKRGSRVIAYCTSDRQGLAVPIMPDVVSVIHEHIIESGSDENGKLDLFLYSRGGASDVPWTLVSMFRQYCHKGSFRVLVPYRCHSAATVICLGADEIVMTKKAELGPIDATISHGPYNPTEGETRERLPVSVEDVTGYFSLLKRFGCERPDETMEGLRELTRKVHPLALGAVNRLLEETKLVGHRLLSTRAEPFSEEDNNDIIKKLSSEVYSHNHAINRSEAVKYLGLGHVKKAEDTRVDDLIWQLYLEYRDLFHLEEPFQPGEHLIERNLEEHTWDDLCLASVESETRFDICKKSVKVRRLRQVPPNLTLNLNNIESPAINLPQLPAEMNQEQIQALIQQLVQASMQGCLNNAVQVGILELLKSMPQRGFEHISFKSGWSTEK